MSSNESDPTFDAIETYARWVAETFKSDVHGKLVYVVDDEKYLAGSDGNIRREIVKRVVRHPDLFEVLRSENPTLYKTALDALKSDNRIGQWDGGVVGTAYYASRFSLEQVLDQCVGAQLTENGDLILDVEAVRKQFTEIVGRLTRNSETFVLLIPLLNLTISLPDQSFELEPGLVFRRFTDNELETLANYGVISPEFKGFPLITEKYRFGCGIEFEIPTIRRASCDTEIGFPPSELIARKFGVRRFLESQSLVQEVLLVLRLAGSGRIVQAGSLMSIRDAPGGGQHIYRHPIDLRTNSQYSLDLETSIQMRNIWRALKAAKSEHRLPDISMRRFNASIDRFTVVDAIVDVVISLEALFLSDQQTDRSELGYRLRLRAAKLLMESGRDPRDVLEMLREAYNVRSRVVHGGDLPATVRIRGVDLEITDFLNELIDLARDCLACGAIKYSVDPEFATTKFWDDLVLGVS